MMELRLQQTGAMADEQGKELGGHPMTRPTRPSRLELFTFYFLGISPDGSYRFPNVHHVARRYGVSADAVLRWLDELDLSPSEILRKDCPLAAMQTDLQLELEDLLPEEVTGRAEEILATVDEARPTRKPWEDRPF